MGGIPIINLFSGAGGFSIGAIQAGGELMLFVDNAPIGCLTLKKNKKFHKPVTRQRFSIAHKIGHLVLHKKKLIVDKIVKYDFRGPNSKMGFDIYEIAANSFPVEVLMPKIFVRKEIKKEI